MGDYADGALVWGLLGWGVGKSSCIFALAEFNMGS